jgi:hypothetical protein
MTVLSLFEYLETPAPSSHHQERDFQRLDVFLEEIRNIYFDK